MQKYIVWESNFKVEQEPTLFPVRQLNKNKNKFKEKNINRQFVHCPPNVFTFWINGHSEMLASTQVFAKIYVLVTRLSDLYLVSALIRNAFSSNLFTNFSWEKLPIHVASILFLLQILLWFPFHYDKHIHRIACRNTRNKWMTLFICSNWQKLRWWLIWAGIKRFNIMIFTGKQSNAEKCWHRTGFELVFLK